MELNKPLDMEAVNEFADMINSNLIDHLSGMEEREMTRVEISNAIIKGLAEFLKTVAVEYANSEFVLKDYLHLISGEAKNLIILDNQRKLKNMDRDLEKLKEVFEAWGTNQALVSQQWGAYSDLIKENIWGNVESAFLECNGSTYDINDLLEMDRNSREDI